MQKQLKLPGLEKKYKKRKVTRMISTRDFNHVVMKSNQHILRLHRFEIEQLIRKTQLKYYFKIRALSIMSNHIHFLIQTPTRDAFANAMRMLSGQIAIQLGRGKLWTKRIWSRIVKRGKAEEVALL